jgi:hypothetical protein
MRWLLFLLRVAFLCNLFFIVCVILRYKNVIDDQSLRGFIVVVGWLIAPVVTVTVNVILLSSYILKRIPLDFIPKWLIVVNIIMQLAQLIIIPL